MAIGMISLIVPVFLTALTVAARTGEEATKRSQAILAAKVVFEELEAAGAGFDSVFEMSESELDNWPTIADQYLALSEDGLLLGKLSTEQYENGLINFGSSPIFFMVKIVGRPADFDTSGGDARSAQVELSLEYPAGAESTRRESIEFISVVTK